MGTQKTNNIVARPDGVAIMDSLRAGVKGIHTSLGKNYNNAVFGRDSSIVGEILSTVNSDITYNIVMALARLQGVKTDKVTNEEPGRIIHEYRTYKNWVANPLIKEIFTWVTSLWGGNREQLQTYFSMDSTPLYVLMVAHLAKVRPSVLDERVVRSDGKSVTIRRCVQDAVEWMARQVNEHGLIEVPRGNFFSLMNQTWRDSPTGYIHPDGRPLDLNRSVAYLEMQALVSEALDKAAELLGHDKWWTLATRIRQATLQRFWQEEEKYFASSIQEGKLGDEVITTLESDPGWLLSTGMFDHVTAHDKEKYVSGIVRRLFSEDFMTDAGVRARALRYKDALALADYHGSYTTWPIDSYMFARGLRRQNLPLLADQVEARVIDAINKAGDFYEYFFVDANNRVVYDPTLATTPFHRKDGQHVTTLLPAMMPESNIAWTVALGLELRDEKARHLVARKQAKWQASLERSVLRSVPHFSLVKVLSTKEQAMPKRAPVDLKETQGQALFLGQIQQLLTFGAIQRVDDKVARGIGAIARRVDLK